VLDIGCGSKPHGLVNLDLFIGDTPHHNFHIEATKYRNFIKGDAQLPPIRRGSFDLVILSHVLEHLLKPAETLAYLSQIAPRLIVVVPNNPVTIENGYHLYSWSETSFKNLLSLYYDEVRIVKTGILDQMPKSRILKMLKRTVLTRFLTERVILRLFPIEIIAICDGSKKYQRG